MSTSLTSTSTIAIRLAAPSDAQSLVRLAALDSAPVPAGDVLLAVVDGQAQAALPVEGGRSIADPFHPTAELVALLRARAAHLGAADRAPRRSLRRLVAREA
jgi:hypothetical protein